jgi:hypothetical protein
MLARSAGSFLTTRGEKGFLKMGGKNSGQILKKVGENLATKFRPE